MKWSSVCWPSSVADVFGRIRDMEKIRTKLIVDAFRDTQSMLPLIPDPTIVQIDEGCPTRKHDDLPEEPLMPPPSEFFITKSGQQIISYFSGKSENHQDKGKQIATDSDSPMKTFKKYYVS
ncbi:unnamed protein product [Lactuca virosa]|uniref:Uncharacterized protein n=1 Tax=Lactuca virosa TaxID=75947 RepID=A0AAU9LFW8_9ASTR|nr:unnamed protein product [Lactuca virosa]